MPLKAEESLLKFSSLKRDPAAGPPIISSVETSDIVKPFPWVKADTRFRYWEMGALAKPQIAR